MSYFSLTIKFNEEKKVPLKILGLEREDYNKFLLEGEFIFNSGLELFKKKRRWTRKG